MTTKIQNVKNTTLAGITKMMGEYIKETERLLIIKGKTAENKASEIEALGRQIMTDLAAFHEKNGMSGKYYLMRQKDSFQTRNFILGAYPKMLECQKNK